MRIDGNSGFLMIVTLVLSAFAAKAQPSGLQSGDLSRMRSVGTVRISPDATQIAYTVENRDRPGRPYSQVWVMEVASGKAWRLAGDTGVTSDPFWSPDGKWIAYLANEKGGSELKIAHPDGSGTTSLAPVMGTNNPTQHPGNNITWSPDSRRI